MKGVESKQLNMVQLQRIAAECECPPHWVDLHHSDDENDDMMNKELFALRVKNGEAWATDDVSGAILDPNEVRKARALEIEYFRKMGVYTKVPRSRARGCNIIIMR